MTVSIETVREGDDEAQHGLYRQAFGIDDPLNPEVLVPRAHRLGAYQGSRLVGTSVLYPAGQWFGGKAVRSGGVNGVAIAIDQRGTGVGQDLLHASLEHMRSHGAVISSLYPSTMHFYRKLGYEAAGVYERLKLPMAQTIRRAPTSCTLEETDPTTKDLREAIYPVLAQRCPGWIARNEIWWRCRTLPGRPWMTHRYLFIARRDHQTVGYIELAYELETVGVFDVVITDLAAIDGPAMNDLMTVPGAFGTIGRHLITTLPGWIRDRATAHAHRFIALQSHPWMLRILDAPGAIAARGFCSGSHAEVPIDLRDPMFDANNQRFVLTVKDGVGHLEPGGSGRVQLSIQDFAPLYSGAQSAHQLAFSGRLHGAEPQDLAALDRVFSGAPPTLPEFF